jgi:hypothetical protein
MRGSAAGVGGAVWPRSLGAGTALVLGLDDRDLGVVGDGVPSWARTSRTPAKGDGTSALTLSVMT